MECIYVYCSVFIIGGASTASAATVRSSKSKFVIFSTYVHTCNLQSNTKAVVTAAD